MSIIQDFSDMFYFVDHQLFLEVSLLLASIILYYSTSLDIHSCCLSFSSTDFSSSTEDWAFRAQTSALPISTSAQFSSFPIVPSNISTQKTLWPQSLVATLAVLHPTILVFWPALPAFAVATLVQQAGGNASPEAPYSLPPIILWNVSYTALPFHFHR